MTLDDHTKLIREVRENLSDEGKISDLLSQLSEGFQTALAEREEMENNLNSTLKDNESLRDANMKLFLRVGIDSKEKEKETISNDEEEILQYETLFSEKGELL